MKLTEAQVLTAVANAASPNSGYINDYLCREHSLAVAAGGKGHPPTSSLVLRRLRSLESGGLIEVVGRYPYGSYGFTWRITPAGRRALSEGSE